MKKKRFYNNKERGGHWTEPEVGRPIAFAEKYDKGDLAEREAPSAAPTASAVSDIARTRAKKEKRRQRLLIAAVCIVLVCLGYIGADVFMIRHAAPLTAFDSRQEEQEENGIENVALQFTANSTDGLCLDGAVMLSSVIDETQKVGNMAVVLEVKRPSGTIGYASSLAAAETFAAVSEAGTKPQESVQQLIDNDILPVASVCCYLDNVAPVRSEDWAVLSEDGTLYTDKSGNTYLNPDNPSAYKYIRDIVQELNRYGVSVFVLSGCSLPQEVAGNYGDGFETLAAKLRRDVGDIKLLEAVDVTIDGMDAESGDINSDGIRHDIENFPQLSANQIYRIASSLDTSELRSALAEAAIESYILTD